MRAVGTTSAGLPRVAFERCEHQQAQAGKSKNLRVAYSLGIIFSYLLKNSIRVNERTVRDGL